MDAAAASTEVGDPTWAPLIDVTDRPITDLLGSGDSKLARSVRRLVRSLDDPDGVIAAFQSYTSTEE